jgi:hypothetical protein
VLPVRPATLSVIICDLHAGHATGNPALVPRVLEVVKSQLCYVVGTVYMDMPLKPNVLEDIARDVSREVYLDLFPCPNIYVFTQQSIPPPPPLEKYHSPNDSVMLEDESGRIKLVGDPIKDAQLVTGVIIGALGVETPNGEFEVIDIVYAGMAPQKQTYGEDNEEKMEVDGTRLSSCFVPFGRCLLFELYSGWPPISAAKPFGRMGSNNIWARCWLSIFARCPDPAPGRISDR